MTFLGYWREWRAIRRLHRRLGRLLTSDAVWTTQAGWNAWRDEYNQLRKWRTYAQRTNPLVRWFT